MEQGVRAAFAGIVTVSVADVPDDCPPVAVAPQVLEPIDTVWLASLGLSPIVTSKDTPTAALVGAEVIDNVLRMKLAVTLWFEVTLLNVQALPLQLPPLALLMLENV